MNTTLKKSVLANSTAAAIAVMAVAQSARAVPINGRFLEDARCDVIPTQDMTHELGLAATFPPNEALAIQVSATNTTICVPNDGIPNDWIVQITNLTTTTWQNLFFVCDVGAKVGNADGGVDDQALAPAIITDGFRIDGTVTVTGGNDNLISESGVVNELFEPGETWRFYVSNFTDPFGTSSPPGFLSPGLFAGSAPPNTAGSNASILASPVPEPTTVGAIGLIAAAMLMRRRRRA